MIPAFLYNIIKYASVSELISDEKYEAFLQIFDLIDRISRIGELCDIFVDKEFGGNDSDKCLYDYLVTLFG